MKSFRFSTMVAAVKAADLVDVIGGAKAMTIFAPTNDAFAKVMLLTLLTRTLYLVSLLSDPL